MRKGWRIASAALLAAAVLLCPFPALAEGADVSSDAPIAPPATPTSAQDELSLLATPTNALFTASEVDTVDTEEALATWLSTHRRGTVYLSGDITITSLYSPLYAYADEGERVVIDTGEFGLIFNGGYVGDYYGNSLLITGKGVSNPVLDVRDMGFIWGRNWNNVLHTLNVTATGGGGQGGTAVRISGIDGTEFIGGNALYEGMIRAYGPEAIGLELCVPMDAYCFSVEAEGEGAVAVKALDDANLYYCKLSAVGADACVAEGANVLLDSCLLSPVPSGSPGIRHVNYRIIKPQQPFYLPIQQGGQADFFSCSATIAGRRCPTSARTGRPRQ